MRIRVVETGFGRELASNSFDERYEMFVPEPVSTVRKNGPARERTGRSCSRSPSGSLMEAPREPMNNSGAPILYEN